MRPVGQCGNRSMNHRAIDSVCDAKGKRIGLERGSEAEWMLGRFTSGREPVTGKLPDLLHFIELEALNHVKPGAVSIIH